MRDFAAHIIDVVKSSLATGARRVGITVCVDDKRDLLSLTVSDDGHGMSRTVLEKTLDPFHNRKKGEQCVHLGLLRLKQAAVHADGDLVIRSREGIGTNVEVTFRRSQMEKKPLGDVADALLGLIVSNPEVQFVCTYIAPGRELCLNTQELMSTITSPWQQSPECVQILKHRLGELRTAMKQ